MRKKALHYWVNERIPLSAVKWLMRREGAGLSRDQVAIFCRTVGPQLGKSRSYGEVKGQLNSSAQRQITHELHSDLVNIIRRIDSLPPTIQALAVHHAFKQGRNLHADQDDLTRRLDEYIGDISAALVSLPPARPGRGRNASQYRLACTVHDAFLEALERKRGGLIVDQLSESFLSLVGFPGIDVKRARQWRTNSTESE